MTERGQREPEAERSEADGSHRMTERGQREPEAERSEADGSHRMTEPVW